MNESRNIAYASGLGHDMPFDGLGGVRLHSSSHRQNIGETVLSDGIAFARRLLQQRCRQYFVAGNAQAVKQSDGIFHLGIDEVGQ